MITLERWYQERPCVLSSARCWMRYPIAYASVYDVTMLCSSISSPFLYCTIVYIILILLRMTTIIQEKIIFKKFCIAGCIDENKTNEFFFVIACKIFVNYWKEVISLFTVLTGVLQVHSSNIYAII